MALTEEQRERMRINREKALEIRRRKQEEAAAAAKEREATATKKVEGNNSSSSNTASIFDFKTGDNIHNTSQQEKGKNANAKILLEDDEDDNDVELEEFEVGASKFVTKREAMQMYCLPEATLSVCKFVEKDNPRNKGWNTMKLYLRSEIRRRARDRHDGMLGLVEERNKRKRKQFERDLEKNKNIFKRSKT